MDDSVSPTKALSPIRTRVKSEAGNLSQSRRSQANSAYSETTPLRDSGTLRDSVASMEPPFSSSAGAESPSQPPQRLRSFHRPTPIPASAIPTRASGISPHSLPAIQDDDEAMSTANAAPERSLHSHRSLSGSLHPSEPQLSRLDKPQPSIARPAADILSSPSEPGPMDETLLGPQHRGSSLTLDTDVNGHAAGYINRQGSRPEVRMETASSLSLGQHYDRQMSDSAAEREHLPEAVQRAMRQLGEEAVTQVRTPQGDVQHVVDVDVDDMPAREKLTSVHSPGIKSLTSHLHGRKPREVTDRDLRAVARFLRMTPGLSRKVIGDLLGENCERCKRLLMIYASTFEFAGKPFEAGLREFLEAFRLPGESQKIDRVLEAFALRYWAQTTHDTLFKSADAVHILAFSAVLLNTDLHNSGVKKKMTMSDFIRNNRGINDNEDFPPEFLEELFNSIACKGFRIPASPQDLHSQPSTLPDRKHKRKAKRGQKAQGPCCWPFSICFS